jgi:lysozyme family protein
MANFNDSINFVLRWEGGETVDSGGFTKYGISQKSYPNLNIAALTIDDAKQIYRRDYWNKIFGDQIRDQSSALALFDYAVNAGPGKAIMDAQRVLNAAGAGLNVDGGMGPLTLAAINARGPAFAQDLTKFRNDFYKRLVEQNPEKYGQYLTGWLRRTTDLMRQIPKVANLAIPLFFALGMFYLMRK